MFLIITPAPANVKNKVPSRQISSNFNKHKTALSPQDLMIFILLIWAHPRPKGRGPGFPLQFLSFTCGKASGISAAIPCANQKPLCGGVG
jgi:hypothetical protein